MNPDNPVTELKGVGAKVAEKLAKLRIKSLMDLLMHFPSRYEDRTKISKLAAMELEQFGVFQGEVVDKTITFGRRRSLQVLIQDDTSANVLRFFHFNKTQEQQFSIGNWVRCFGQPSLGRTGLELYHPEYTVIASPDAPINGSLTAVYPLTDGVTQFLLRKLVQQALALINQDAIIDYLPEHLKSSTGWPNMIAALQQIHLPIPTDDIAALFDKTHPAIQRFVFEEMVAHSISRVEFRKKLAQLNSPKIQLDSELKTKFLAQLPFSPTAAQSRVLDEIEQNFISPMPMLRLVQGDVGSGKTLVAAMAALHVVGSGYQVAVLAPTEILANQHAVNFSNWFEPLGISCQLLTGKLKAADKRAAQEQIASGKAQVIIGTQALFQDAVEYSHLGLVISDEQHRFGVSQRLQLLEKSDSDYIPHQLTMTATPIPRTLAMAVFGDLAVSVIDELPPGRQPVETTLVHEQKRDKLIERIAHIMQEGIQVYWVCTLVEESEHIRAQDAEQRYQELQQYLPNHRIGLLHGRMKPDEKAQVMAAFVNRDIDILVATTVIEVGVDVPNASIMVIENAERLGLSQLHQLRGRVGRGEKKSYCLLLHSAKLSQLAQERLSIMKQTSDGFKIAEFDLKLRGPGEVLGTQQTGELQFKLADLIEHQDLLEQAQAFAETLVQNNPDIAAQLVNRWFSHKLDFAFV